MTTGVENMAQLHQFLNRESVLTIASSDACGPWSAPVLYVADTVAEPFALYFLSSPNSRHVKSIPSNGSAAVSIYSDYTGDWQSICGVQIYCTIEKEPDKDRVADRYFARFPEIWKLIDSPATEQERLIGSAFAKSNFYKVSPSFVRFTSNGDNFAGRTEWQLKEL